MAREGKQSAIPIFDADSHVVEPVTVWSEYLEPEYRSAARSAFWREDGELAPVTLLNGQPAGQPRLRPDPALPVAMAGPHEDVHDDIPRHAIWRVGMSAGDVGALDPRTRHEPNPGATDPVARLADMDAMGIDQALLFPTYFCEYFPLVQDPDLAAALARAYNGWLLDFSRTAPDRLFPVAVLPIQEIGAAVRELGRTAELGFKAAMVRPLFVSGRYPHHPYYHPLWKACEELGIVLCSHPSSGVSAPELDANSPFIERVSANLRIGHPVAEAVAPTMDNGILLTAVMAEGLLERFPDVKLYLAHSRASWVHLYLEKTEGYLWLSTQKRAVSLEPGDVFFDRSTLVGFDTSESAVAEMPDLFESWAAWGSFYPNHDTYTPSECLDRLEHHAVSDSIKRKLMGENAARLLGVRQASLAQDQV